MLNPLPLGMLTCNTVWEIWKKKKEKKSCPWLVSAFIEPVFINQLFEKKLILNKFRRHFDPSNAHPSSLSSHSSSWLLFVDVVFHHPNSATSLHILRIKNRRSPPHPNPPSPFLLHSPTSSNLVPFTALKTPPRTLFVLACLCITASIASSWTPELVEVQDLLSRRD